MSISSGKITWTPSKRFNGRMYTPLALVSTLWLVFKIAKHVWFGHSVINTSTLIRILCNIALAWYLSLHVGVGGNGYFFNAHYYGWLVSESRQCMDEYEPLLRLTTILLLLLLLLIIIIIYVTGLQYIIYDTKVIYHCGKLQHNREDCIGKIMSYFC